MTILNTYSQATDSFMNIFLSAAAGGLLFGLITVIVLNILENHLGKDIKHDVAILVATMLLTGVVAGIIASVILPKSPVTKYEVIFDDGISAKEVLSKYKVEDQRGEIFTIIEKETTENQ